MGIYRFSKISLDSSWNISLKGTFVTYVGLVWSWPLTSWPAKLNTPSPCSVGHLYRLASNWFIRFQHIVFTSLVTDGRMAVPRTDGQTYERKTIWLRLPVQSCPWVGWPAGWVGSRLCSFRWGELRWVEYDKCIFWRLGPTQHTIARDRASKIQGVRKIVGRFRPISRFISKTVQDTAIVTMEDH